ncbi:hypothetical protein ASPZODRAFT_127556 [Penicilliopsis zonata CBS 506.65]|uniref:Uncharacterized protein n=1 Tax=Penicilliopsis zonata CBS 506.65 TaxID=1073090 RepID=A0A1L9SWJ4_9EURO|nr:hypothetical protein ASPZODRAFT_127556 [Penicilliopsis zonata CBS 506.65]OJJ51477.1 hypothetical protein ASPZODRAFT_127556 [Penicilliopsis zonata CBS 506.65]
MKQCLGSGRLVHLGRRSFSFELAGSTRRSWLFRIPSFNTQRNQDGSRLWSRQFSAGAVRPGQPKLAQSRLATWTHQLEEFLPPPLKDGPMSTGQVDPRNASQAIDVMSERSLKLCTVLSKARASDNVNPIVDLGLKHNRWDAAHSLLSMLIDSAEALGHTSTPARPLSNLDWGLSTGKSLDALTSSNTPMTTLPLAPDARSTAFRHSLNTSTARSRTDNLSQRCMAEVWRGLGLIILEAADSPSNTSDLAMSHVFHLLARLHHSGSISEKVYKYTRPDDGVTLYRPPSMHFLSTHIMNVLTDAAWRVHEADMVAEAAAAGKESPYLPLNHWNIGIRKLGPEIWFELVLWCCVEHGHVMEGIWLLEQMKARTGHLAWGVKSWIPFLGNLKAVKETNVDIQEFWSDSNDDHSLTRSRKESTAFHGLAKRTISQEVVESLMDGLVNQVYLGVGPSGLSPSALLQNIDRLRFIINQESCTDLGSTTRTSNRLTIRILESECIDPAVDPSSLEKLLKSHNNVRPPWDDQVSTLKEELSNITQTQLYDETFAFPGLIEYNIRCYVFLCQIGGAFDSFTWVQQIADSNKSQRILQFFEKFEQLDAKDLTSLDLGPPETGHIYGSPIPGLSNVTLAMLLDLATASRAYEFGNWLLFSDDVDGPPISPIQYGDQAIAPSILRFASATKNTTLCNQVTQSLSPPLSSNTLKAILNARISTGNLQLATDMLKYLRDYKLRSWGHSNVTTLAAALLRMNHNGAENQIDAGKNEQGEESLAQAKDLFLGLFNGKFDSPTNLPIRDFHRKALYSLHQVLKSIPGILQDLAPQVTLQYNPEFARRTLVHIPAEAFNTLLAAVVDVSGSAAGRQLWKRWCVEPASLSASRLREGGITNLYRAHERNFRRGDPHFDPVRFAQQRGKIAIPDLNTVRIITQAAIRESEESQAHAGSEPSSTSTTTDPDVVLGFCLGKFRRFQLSDDQIEREMGGHFERIRNYHRIHLGKKH